MKRTTGIVWVIAALALAGNACQKASPPAGEAPPKDADAPETAAPQAKTTAALIGDVRMLPLAAPDVSTLEEAQRKAIWAQWQALYDADDTCYAQTGPQALRVHRMLSQILVHPQGVPARNHIARYFSAFALHKGHRDRATQRLLRARYIPGELASAALVALESGADIPLDVPGQVADAGADRVAELEALLQWVRPYIFGAPLQTALHSAPQGDTGAGETPGEASDVPDAPDASDTDDAMASVCPPAWVVWDADVLRAETEAVRHMYAALENRVREVGGRKSTRPAKAPGVVRAVNVLSMGGALGPELPDLASAVATGPVLDGGAGERRFAVNVAEALFPVLGDALAAAVIADPAQLARHRALGLQMQYARWVLREALGHGVDGTEHRPTAWFQNRLGARAPLLAVLRADLAALYMAYDADVQRLGLVPAEGGPQAFVETYLFGALAAGALWPHYFETLEGRAALMLLNHLLDQGVLVVPEAAESADAPTGVVTLPDVSRVRGSIAELLAEVRRIRFAGDGTGAEKLCAELSELRAPVAARLRTVVAGVAVPKRVGLVYPLPQWGVDATGARQLTALHAQTDFLARELHASRPAP